MKTTLISSPQGTGKTLLISQLIDEDEVLDFHDIVSRVKSFGYEPENYHQDRNYMVFENVYPHFDLLQLINFAKRKDKNLILITNLHHSEFQEYQIDINIGTSFNYK